MDCFVKQSSKKINRFEVKKLFNGLFAPEAQFQWSKEPPPEAND